MNNEKRICAHCSKEFTPLRKHAIYCSGTCKQYCYLSRKTGEQVIAQKNLPIQEVDQSIPALIIEDHEPEKQLAPVLPEIQVQTVNPVKSPVIKSPVKKLKAFSDFIFEEKDWVNEMLYYWEEIDEPNSIHKRSIINVLQKIKPFYDAILEFDGESLTLSEVKKFQRDLIRFDRSPALDNVQCMFPAIRNYFRIFEKVQDFIDQMEFNGLTEFTCKLKPETKAFLEVNLNLIEEYKISCPTGWELP